MHKLSFIVPSYVGMSRDNRPPSVLRSHGAPPNLDSAPALKVMRKARADGTCADHNKGNQDLTLWLMGFLPDYGVIL